MSAAIRAFRPRLPIQIGALFIGLALLVPFGRINFISIWLTASFGALFLVGAWLGAKRARLANSRLASIYVTGYGALWRGITISLFLALWFGFASRAGYRP